MKHEGVIYIRPALSQRADRAQPRRPARLRGMQRCAQAAAAPCCRAGRGRRRGLAARHRRCCGPEATRVRALICASERIDWICDPHAAPVERKPLCVLRVGEDRLPAGEPRRLRSNAAPATVCIGARAAPSRRGRSARSTHRRARVPAPAHSCEVAVRGSRRGDEEHQPDGVASDVHGGGVSNTRLRSSQAFGRARTANQSSGNAAATKTTSSGFRTTSRRPQSPKPLAAGSLWSTPT